MSCARCAGTDHDADDHAVAAAALVAIGKRTRKTWGKPPSGKARLGKRATDQGEGQACHLCGVRFPRRRPWDVRPAWVAERIGRMHYLVCHPVAGRICAARAALREDVNE